MMCIILYTHKHTLGKSSTTFKSVKSFSRTNGEHTEVGIKKLRKSVKLFNGLPDVDGRTVGLTMRTRDRGGSVRNA